ncbi:MAG: radical SAM protein [Myxococcota bacterium]|nr:radical SAM protein [Myxococcota bacterium]
MHLPKDAVILPVSRGGLLLSARHAVFCPVPSAELERLRVALAEGSLSGLSAELMSSLTKHGCFDPPQAEVETSALVQIQLTNACNLACSYCCTASGESRASELSFEDVASVLAETRRIHGVGAKVALLGGEPLLRSWALDAAEEALRLELTCTLFSNGMALIDPALARRAAELMRRGLELRISLAGPTRALCDEASGASRFDAVLEALHRLADFGATPIVDLMLLPQHVDTVAQHLPELRRRLPKGSVLCFGLAYHAGREEGEHVFAARHELEAALDRIVFEAGERIKAPTPKQRAKRRDGCACALGKHLHVRSDGGLFTCFKMEEQVGDLRQGFAQAIERAMANPRPAYSLDLCRECPLVSLCGGGCRSDNFLYTGNPEAPICGPWRVRVLSELLFEDAVDALEWPAHQLLAEAQRRGLEAPAALPRARRSTHLLSAAPR